MKLSDFDYQLPGDLIAQKPAERREGSRMLVVDRRSATLHDDEFVRFPDVLRPDDLLVLNNTEVFPARLFGRSETGAQIEIFLMEEHDAGVWKALARPVRRLKPGKRITFGSQLAGTILDIDPEGRVRIVFEFEGDFREVLNRVGQTPLPPYIKRGIGELDQDRERYQTVYASSSGAIAAPTAGLHFTDEILRRVRERGIEIAEITLHVGYGTFEPVRAAKLSQHSVLPERYEIGEDAASMLNAARKDARRIIAVGTTTTRALETAASKGAPIQSDRCPAYKLPSASELAFNFGFNFWRARTYNGCIQACRRLPLSFL
jgi:S-adenosylmethionine:tRNA ribosyltransferase-isomerase